MRPRLWWITACLLRSVGEKDWAQRCLNHTRSYYR